MRKLIGRFLALASLAFFCIGCILMCTHLREYQHSSDAYDVILDEVIVRTDSSKDTADSKKSNEQEFQVDWEKLGGTDIIAWIRFGDAINYPILQGDDNNYYLNHLYNGEYNICGSIFANYDNSSDFTDDNTIVYGHRTINSSMFGTLANYKDPAYGTKEFYIYLPDGTKHTYKLFSVADVQDAGKAYQYLFSDDFKAYQEYMKSISLYDTGVPVDETSRLVSLSTCSKYGSSEGHRVMVQGIEVQVEQVQEPASWYLSLPVK